MRSIPPADPIDRIDPADPIDRIEPAEPIDRIEPAEPIEKMDPADPIDRIDPADPIERIDMTEPVQRMERIEPIERIERTEAIDRTDPPESTVGGDVIERCGIAAADDAIEPAHGTDRDDVTELRERPGSLQRRVRSDHMRGAYPVAGFDESCSNLSSL